MKLYTISDNFAQEKPPRFEKTETRGLMFFPFFDFSYSGSFQVLIITTGKLPEFQLVNFSLTYA